MTRLTQEELDALGEEIEQHPIGNPLRRRSATLNSRKRILSRMESADQASMEQGEKPGQGIENRVMPKPHPFYEPEYRALTDTLTAYEIAAAQERQMRDRMVACWRDVLHSLLKQVGPIDPQGIHKVIDTMDNFLNRAGGRRK